MENTAVSLYAVSWEVVLLFSRHRNINVRTLPLASSVIFCHKTEKRAGICLCQMQSSINPCSMWCVFVKCSALFWPLRKYERLWWVQKQIRGEQMKDVPFDSAHSTYVFKINLSTHKCCSNLCCVAWRPTTLNNASQVGICNVRNAQEPSLRWIKTLFSVFVASFVCQSGLNSLFGPEAGARLCRFYSFDDLDFQCRFWRVTFNSCVQEEFF